MAAATARSAMFRGCNGVQGATAMLAFLAIVAMWLL